MTRKIYRVARGKDRVVRGTVPPVKFKINRKGKD